MRAEVKRLALALSLVVLSACGSGQNGTVELPDAMDARLATNTKDVHPTKDQKSADIRTVKLSIKGDVMEILITVEGSVRDDIPNDVLEGPDWFVQLWKDSDEGAPAGIVGIVRRGTISLSGQDVRAGWKILACVGQASCDNDAAGSALSITGKTIKAVVPLKDLPKLMKPFTWVAFSFWNETTDLKTSFSDFVPDGAQPAKGGSGFTPPDKRAAFK